MKKINLFTVLFVIIFSCKNGNHDDQKHSGINISTNNELIIAFGSCNNPNLENVLWDDILKDEPSIWIWGGDIVYADTENPEKMRKDYQAVLDQEGYKKLQEQAIILGTWDDHDYGVNDGGEEYAMKEESQQIFLDFLGIDKNDERRKREGIYSSELFYTNSGSVKIILLDTRYFRTALTPSETPNKRYQHNLYGKGTILGEKQWQWLEHELESSEADFNIIVSSIQVLSNEHGFETWGNFPHEVDKLKNLLIETKANNVIILSGDRHISEFSKETITGLDYELIDFTSSGLTHSYSNFSGEDNPFRIGSVVHDISYGLLKIDFENKTVIMEMKGDGQLVQQKMKQTY